MAETSGFFDALYNEESHTYDLEYIAAEFASYFSLFVGNGVFGSPTNQLKVIPGTGMKVIVSPGWAFINGYWYHNDEELELTVPSNISSSSRVDSVVCRWDSTERKISIGYQVGTTEVVRNSITYDLKLAEVTVLSGASSVSGSKMTDTRTDETVCGFVTHILEVQTTADLFAQYEAIFTEWFNSIKGQLDGDIGAYLLASVGDVTNLTTNDKSNLVAAINEVKKLTDNLKDGSTLAGAAKKLNSGAKINGVLFTGEQDITIKDNSKPSVVYATEEPTSVPANTIVFVYEEG